MSDRSRRLGPSTSLCPVNVRRASMTDDEFWADVFPQLDCDPDDDIPDPPAVAYIDAACAVCGHVGPCGYDANGLPMAHVQDDE